ncbi:unnamed protein product [Durusdinium trenchii]|uniref:Uncharacterized protein n=1 Tax=Durusdinium trenchii TaxID=1381693 RepID=A0ABP0IYX0_9DINO
MQVLGAVIGQSVTFFAGNENGGAEDRARGVRDVAAQTKQINVDNFTKKTTRSGTVGSQASLWTRLIWNLALPGLGGDVNSASKSAPAAIAKWTKQAKQASVLLISSEFGYPFRLQTAG